MTTLSAASAAEDQDALAELAAQALETGDEERVIAKIRAGAERHRSALLWQWTGLLHRALDEHQHAIDCFGQAASLAPADTKIAQALAHTAMEAGLDAVALFQRARSLAPRDGSILIGLTAARAAAGDGARAAEELGAALEGAPLWTDGHQQLAQLLSTLGHADQATESLDRAIARFPREPALREALLNLQLRRGAYEPLRRIVDEARAAGADLPKLAIYEAIHAAEYDEQLTPAVLFGPASRAFDSALDIWRVRHLLRRGAADAALPILDRGLQQEQSAELWPYAATAWRMAGDPRAEWLEGDPRFVQVFDLRATLPPLDGLAATLRSLHVARGEYLDQSVRGGTQTDGPLFSRIDPLIRDVRAAIVEAVGNYLSKLPPPDPGHPLLRHRRDRSIRFSGSWSVRLRSGGRHSNHVHPQGWISSALYIALPQRTQRDEDDAGWLTLGEADARLQLDLGPWRKIEPKPGQLVLFPSWMWHGTLPFAEGERLTVAFDVRPPL